MGFQSTKTYGQDEGLSCAFRQWRANHSHCQLLHGYALGFKFTFECDSRDARGWVMDFGGLKSLKQWLKNAFDHKVCIDRADPELSRFIELASAGVIHLNVTDGVGVETFAKMAYEMAGALLDMDYPDDVRNRNLRVISCECSEHGANSAIYYTEK
jgi:6-pyruvoyltetrahydropterin/6-carboxytetrahydropterin synthase